MHRVHFDISMSLMEISKSIPQTLNYSERNQILPKNDTQKSRNSQKNDTQKSGNSPKRHPKIREQPQKSTQNNGTSPYRSICKLPPPPRAKRKTFPINMMDFRSSLIKHTENWWS